MNVSGMMKNKHLSKAVASQKFYEFRIKLKVKCDENGIELRIVDRFYPSSKLCHCCGAIKKDLEVVAAEVKHWHGAAYGKRKKIQQIRTMSLSIRK